MSCRLILRDEAEDELNGAIDWYEARAPGLGARFLAAIEAQFQAIRATPLVHAAIYRRTRKTKVRRFPYCVYYRVHVGTVVVISVFHTSRNPAVWRRRS